MEEPLKRKVVHRPPIMPLLPTIEEEDKLSWLRIMWRYRLQFQSMAAPSTVIIAGGMKMAWSIFEAPPPSQNLVDHPHQTLLLASAWFMGVILGAAMAATFVQRVTKNFAYYTSGVLLLIGGLFFTVVPTVFNALLCSCILEGSAYGLTQVQALVTGGEVAHKDVRGLVLSIERTSLWLGICLQLLCTRLWYQLEPAFGYSMHPHRLQGLLICSLGVAACIFAFLHRLESPLLLQRQDSDLAATYTLKRMYGIHHHPSSDVLRMRDDYKQLLTHDAGLSCCGTLCQRNIIPLLKLTLLRCFVALSFSLPFNRVFLTVGWGGLYCDMNCIFLVAMSGLVGSCIGGLLVDPYGRRKIATINLVLSSIFLFPAGGIFRHLQIHDYSICPIYLEIVGFLMLLHQFFISLGSSIVSTVYAAEAFTLSIKAKCIAAMTICEHLLFIGMTVFAYHVDYSNSTLFFAMGGACLLFVLLVYFFLPETKLLTLNECLVKFRKVP